jgi:hypothetical protein
MRTEMVEPEKHTPSTSCLKGRRVIGPIGWIPASSRGRNLDAYFRQRKMFIRAETAQGQAAGTQSADVSTNSHFIKKLKLADLRRQHGGRRF